MEVYIDLVFFVSFGMNLFILLIEARLLRLHCGLWLLLASFVSSALFCAVFWLTDGNMRVMLFLLPGAGVYIAYRPKDLLSFGKQYLVCLIVTLATGGLMTSASYVGGLGFLALAAKNVFSPVPVILLLTGSLLTALLAFLLRMAFKRFSSRQLLLTVGLDGREVSMPALVDSGQNLTDPIGDYPVCVCEYSALKGLLPDEVCLLFDSQGEDDLESLLPALSGSFSVRVRLIPFKSVGKTGLMLGFMPDFVEYETIGRKKTVIGIYNGCLTKNGDYRALINADVY